MADIDIKFPTMDEFAKEVAEKALDEFLYDGKSIREWMQIIASEDIISRQAVINLIRRCNSALEEPRIFDCHDAGVKFEQYVMKLPPAMSQEPILDKIRAEIEQLPRYGAKFLNGYFTVHVDVDEVLQIIDKYRGEVDCRECKAEHDCYECKKYTESEES